MLIISHYAQNVMLSNISHPQYHPDVFGGGIPVYSVAHNNYHKQCSLEFFVHTNYMVKYVKNEIQTISNFQHLHHQLACYGCLALDTYAHLYIGKLILAQH